MNRYRDRTQAGELLAEALRDLAGRPDATVLGLVRGGVPVAARVAQRLGLPLDALVVRKLGVPWAPELAFGALGPGGVRVLNDVAARLSDRQIAKITQREAGELLRREALYRAGRGPIELAGRVAVIVDDGLATGSTALAAIMVARSLGAAEVVLAAPVGSAQAVEWLAASATVVCPRRPADFAAVSWYFDTFEQVSDETVVDLLAN
jgi:putative phosphoribosyl transferase